MALAGSRVWRTCAGPALEPGSAAYGMSCRQRLRLVTSTQLAVPRCWCRATAEPHPGPDRRAGRRVGANSDLALRASRSGIAKLPGGGAWTSAEVRQRAHGDPDAWSVGDYHVGKDITYALDR
jgi:hypothetical protein